MDKMSFKEHQEYGLELQRCFESIQSFAVKIANTYGRNSDAAESLFQAVDKLMESKCAMDDIVCRDYRNEETHDLVSCYYAHHRLADDS